MNITLLADPNPLEYEPLLPDWLLTLLGIILAICVLNYIYKASKASKKQSNQN